MHHPTNRITHTTAVVTPVVENWLEREIAQREMKDLTTKLHLAPPYMEAGEFLLCCMSGPLPYVQCHITVNKMC